jgi:hypothetical protein
MKNLKYYKKCELKIKIENIFLSLSFMVGFTNKGKILYYIYLTIK